jgi:hypothetical protein
MFLMDWMNGCCLMLHPFVHFRLICQQGKGIGFTFDKWKSGQNNTAFGIREVVFGSDTDGSL